MSTRLESPYIVSDPDILGGTPVFKGTRVPVEVLFDYLQHSSLEEFLKGYPQVSRKMANAVLAVVAKYFSQKSPQKSHEGATG